MTKTNNSKQVASFDESASNTQINIIVDGCKVQLNFPPKSEDTAVKDVKRMMLGGVVKP